MTYKILFLDIDGTILKPDHTYDDSTKEAITQLQSQGIEVFICTGRPLHEVMELAEELHVDSYIGYNGAYAVYQNETIIDAPMDAKSVEQFLQVAKENNHEMVLYTNGKNYFTSLDQPFVQTFIDTFQLQHNELYTNETADKTLGVTVMNINHSEENLYEIAPNLRMSQVNIAGIENSYDIIRTNVNKGEAVDRILERLNITKEQAIAFGDGMNDKEMLLSVGEGFAMENGDPELFQYAKHTTSAVTNSGIFNGLKTLGLVK
ncbi:Cof subfamily protein (haloacid dehalogenase superfamily) [Virgibacillus halotolerans]|uniref:HAD family hydrolase n=1 Tax=Virgibacillus halotolerans TaxID=1071053 RepID=UPI00195FC399|nr:HAD family hydrolase [Virgibacillus halotolerans]MBM7601887.1 Cof subfamily protein (haloacid dehalogenase superfamily) [Virgibacillus halotolerans]